jgi:hypothetical protein
MSVLAAIAVMVKQEASSDPSVVANNEMINELLATPESEKKEKL